MTIVDVISLVASIASLILAIIAIWLSWAFFNKSSEASDKTNEASKSVMSSVEKLEKLFDKLYSDTFSIVKDTVSDMRGHIWSGQQNFQKPESIEDELAKKTEHKIANLKTELSSELSKVLAEQSKAGDKLQSLETSLTTLLNKAVVETKNIEAVVKEETLREYLFRSFISIKKKRRKIIADYIVDLAIENGINPPELLDELNKMKEDGFINFEGDRISNGTTEITILKELK
ncbi:hypothetical protein SAMN04488132_10129 [Sediminibacterium ginsengisoli]|uniref:Uncharacterized protein n=2 Tax=Sediminibacterium ginsengisoli TaxID=413434 RepID=A0A1T4JPJ1_9BACT|nr:hypothetical protein SAMN04488132_10129 [Sediminibacterium ginsengisoli]